MKFCVLGPVRAWRGDTELDLGPPKQRALLALLLVHAGRPVSFDEILGTLWGESPPDTAVNVVHRHIGALRRLFEPDLPARGTSRWLIRSSGGYRLDVDPQSIDLSRFRSLRQEAARLAELDRRGEAAGKLLEALSLWHGPTAAGISPEIRSQQTFTTVDGERLSALKSAAEWVPAAEPAVAEGVLAALRQAALEHPLDEVLQARLMLVLAATGNQAEALEVYRSVRDALAGDLGLDPGPDLRAAQQQVLRLMTPTPQTAASPAEEQRAAAPRLAQLPADLAVFAGRRHELDQFRTLLSESAEARPASMVTIGGMAGVGKTTLAVHWAHQVAHLFPDGQLYADLRGFHPSGVVTSPAEAMLSFLDALGVPPHRVPPSLESQAALFRSLLAGRRMLIVLDNARDSEHVRSLLPGAPGCLTIVTSRHQLYDLVAAQGATAVTLDLMPHAEARELLSRRIGAARVGLEPRAAADIIELSGRLPLILAMVSARAAMNRGFSLHSIADELSASHGSLDAFSGESPRSDARSVFAWSYRTLTPAAARLFRLMGLHPGPDCSLAAAACLTRQTAAQLRPQLTELLRAHLIVETVPGRFGCHDLLRAYAGELAQQPESAEETARARCRLYDHYLHSAHAASSVLFPGRERLELEPPVVGADPVTVLDQPAAVAWLDTELAVLIAAIEQDARHGSGRRSWQLATALELYLDRIGSWQVQWDVQSTAAEAAERIGDRHGEACTQRSLGFVNGRLRRWAEADLHLNRALELFAEIGDRDGEARAHRLSAILANQRKRHHEALDHYRIASELYRSSGWASGQASVHNEVGWTHILLGEYAEAVVRCRQAIEGHREIGDRNGQAAAWDSLGYAQHHMGEYDDALSSFGHAARLYRLTCDRYLEADTLVHIGDAQLAAGRDGPAAQAWRQALEILDGIGHPDADPVRDKVRSLGARSGSDAERSSEFRHSFG
ncbi:AfsR/SARP family transcriptional regulator [Couchioplanes caeruleus]|uniref:AfsR family transcriptional regulator n=2 Tax=Couchioplanes caeruleus TaxID=56438 RepID=A0A1K0FDV4_9ACTN|nr:BTAD domain-containing putative transcriptional regulator [Couchioplanes caeruleus]OJF11001.1 AfsR family transcriptional regulator [Couchioplanes caeruleus subsp. caeruleus]ROP29834.1 DNA-binding SARP family transcriptional activator [Couchioplanes caeruleus]